MNRKTVLSGKKHILSNEVLPACFIYLDNALPVGNYWLCAYSAHSLTADHLLLHGSKRRIKIVQDAAELVKEETSTSQRK